MRTAVKKIYKGFVSVRSYIVEECIKNRQNLLITVGKLQMSVPFEEVCNGFQLHRIKFQSQYKKSQKYELVEFLWKPNILPQKIEEKLLEQPCLF